MLDVGEATVVGVVEMPDFVEKVRVPRPPLLAVQVMSLLAIIVVRAVDILRPGQIPVDAQAKAEFAMQVAQQGVFDEVVGIAQIAFLHLEAFLFSWLSLGTLPALSSPTPE